MGLYDRGEDGRLTRRTTVETDVVGERTDVAKLVGVEQPDLVLLNDGDLTYAKVRFDARSLATVRESIHLIDDSLARAVCWGALWDMTRDAELSAGDFVALVLQGLPDESDETAVKQLPIYVQVAVEQLAHPSKRGALPPHVGAAACGTSWSTRRPAATTSSPSSRRSPAPPASACLRRRTAARPAAPRGWTCSRRCSTGASSSRA